MQKYIYILLFALICTVNIFAQDYWLRVPSPTTKQLMRCHLIDTIYGWACGEFGAIVHTSNSGANWVAQNSGITQFSIDDIFFINQRIGWALANDYLFQGSIILRTTNGGQNWTNSRYPDTSVVLNTVYFLDSLNGYFGCSFPGKIFKTTNAGANWNECTIDTQFCPILYISPKNRFNFLNAQTGYACGGQFDIQGMVWKTTDAGLNWVTYCVTAEPLFAIKVINSNKVIATGGDFEYGSWTVQTHNSGSNWFYDSTTCGGIGRDLAFRTPSELWIPCTFSGKFALNLDSGSLSSPWYCINTPDSIHPYAADFVTPTYGWAFGNGGAILKYNTSVIGINENQNQVPLKSALFQNYPNPFNPTTTINYYIAQASPVKITVYDLLGKQMYVFVEDIKSAGFHKFNFNSFGLASGVYFYKIEAGDYEESKKMVILK